ncbi:3-oxo-tetronate kinase [Brucella pituitosa]|uniref:3-oxo-tetronate kinase n=1 Tax=Brucella pituitosa TaxID=571256 RepID=UPI0009A17BE3|nr:3-oxo-tetronate kinase [Brucella pituitosa]
MAIALGAIADDFTGATDLAALLARSGYPVSLRLGLPDKNEPVAQGCAIEIIALKIRNAPRETAVAHALAAYDWLKQRGLNKLYWKYCSTFDSTADGNIGPVAEALMHATAAQQTIYCPAFPENGRTVFMGHLFVGDRLLSDTAMKDHPLTPMRDSNLLRLLAPQLQGKVGLVNRLTIAKGVKSVRAALAALKASGIAHVVMDAVADADLATIATATLDLPLLTGGSALAMPLPALLDAQGLLQAKANPAAPPDLGAGQIVLSGSCSAMTLKQVAAFQNHAQSYRLDPIRLAQPGGSRAVIQWLQTVPVTAPKLIYASTDTSGLKAAQAALGVERAGQIVEQTLAEIAVAAFALGTRRFVVAGGETSGAVAQALGIKKLRVGREIAPGVPWTYATTQGASVALALKSGNFGTSSFFRDAFNMLEAG